MPPTHQFVEKTAPKKPLEKARWLMWLLNLPPWAWLVVFFMVPIAMVWVYSFGEKAGLVEINIVWTWENYKRIFEPIYLSIFFKSFLVVTVATFVCVVIAYPVAIAMCFVDKKWQPWLLLVIILPFWINVLIRTYGLIAIIRDQGTINGIIGMAWQGMQKVIELTGLPWAMPDFTPIQMMNTGFSVYLGVIYSFIPFMILPI